MAASFQRPPSPPKHRWDRQRSPAEKLAAVPTFPPMKASSHNAYTAPPSRQAEPRRIAGTSSAYPKQSKPAANPAAPAPKTAPPPARYSPSPIRSVHRSHRSPRPRTKRASSLPYPQSNTARKSVPALKTGVKVVQPIPHLRQKPANPTKGSGFDSRRPYGLGLGLWGFGVLVFSVLAVFPVKCGVNWCKRFAGWQQKRRKRKKGRKSL